MERKIKNNFFKNGMLTQEGINKILEKMRKMKPTLWETYTDKSIAKYRMIYYFKKRL
jgi:hypothetical protein